MKTPSFERINKSKYSGKIYYTGTRGVHENSAWFKYYWWIFTAESPVDGDEFLSSDNRLNSYEYEKEIERIKKLRLEAWIYNQKLHRLGSNSPFDEKKLRSKGITDFAPSFDQDQDPVDSEGFK